ncbi:hypothetical protein BUALT_Bualt11G0037900 [Buddleja alternifolia]|uniref:HAT C-terminal dimerisation domain-containing protein n=1 Tax=Buddleja alternifolia TaxID=168488 RepID=A0AAV6WZD8_9LAMI|nr:hypothetical protein BUALT_Bualt11G0037900 [Buddleja alternifolia]
MAIHLYKNNSYFLIHIVILIILPNVLKRTPNLRRPIYIKSALSLTFGGRKWRNGNRAKRFLLEEQSENPKPVPSSSNQTSADLDIDENVDTVKFLATQFEKHLEENDYIETKSELTRYLGENCEKNVESFNVLKWWKHNSMKYRVLSQIARDVLAIPVSTVASESAFSTNGRILDPYRSSLNPEMVEGLVCCQNWLRSEPFTIDIQEFMKEVPIEEVEKYEEVIKEFKTCGTSVEVQVIDN